MATVSETTRSTRITLGSLTAGPFSVGFRLFDSDGLEVYVDGLASTAYTLSATFANGYSDAATITFDSALADGTVVQIDGRMIPGRSDDYVNPDPGLTEKMNIELARIWAAVSETRMLARRAIRGLDEVEAVEGVTSDGFVGAEDFAAQALAAAEAAELARDEAVAIEATLPQWQGSWITATAYVFGDLVYEAGSTYFCVVGHTSGTFSTDLAAMKWEIFAQKGAAGAGAGDVIAANNGSDFANAASVRTNLGLAIGTNVQAYNQLLGAVSGLASNGLMARLSGSTAAARTITGTANQITVTNGDGVSGNPTIAAVVASQAEAEAGTDTTKLMTAQRTAQAIAALAPDSGGRVLLADQTLGSAAASMSFTEFDNAIFEWYEFELTRFKPGTDNNSLRMRLSTDGGATYDSGASDYSYSIIGLKAGSGLNSAAAAATAIVLADNIGNATTDDGVCGTIKLYNAPTNARKTMVTAMLAGATSTDSIGAFFSTGQRLAAQNTDAVRFLFGTGDIGANSRVRMYGIIS